MNSGYAEAYCNRGAAYAAMGELDKAIADCSEAIRLNPTLAEAYCNRGFAYVVVGNRDKAMDDFKRVQELASIRGEK